MTVLIVEQKYTQMNLASCVLAAINLCVLYLYILFSANRARLNVKLIRNGDSLFHGATV